MAKTEEKEEEGPGWGCLSRAKIWTEGSFEAKRAFLLTTRVRVERVKSSDDRVVTLIIQPGGTEEERGTLTIFDARKHAIPKSIKENTFSFGISPTPSAGNEVNVLIRALMEQSLPVMFWGTVVSTRALQVQMAQEYPQLDSFSVLWYTDAMSRTTLPAPRRALLPERSLLVVAPPAMLGNKVCLGIVHASA